MNPLESPSRRPFRVAPRIASPEEMEQANEERRGNFRFLAAEAEMELLRERPNPEGWMLERWVEHPDERVPAAFLWHLRRRPGEQARSVERIAQRARAEARREGVLWTPLVDAAAAHLSDQVMGSPKKTREARSTLARWASQESDPEEILSVLAFRDWDVHREVIRSAAEPTLTVEVLRSFLSRSHCPHFVPQNPNLAPEQVRLLALWGVGALKSVIPAWVPEPPRLDANGGASLLRSLQEHGHPLSRDIQNRLLKAMSRGAENDRLAVAPLLDGDDLRASDLDSILSRFGPRMGWVERIARHPAATAEQVLRIFEEADSLEVRLAIAPLPQVRQHEPLREAVRQDSSLRVLAAFFGALPEAELASELDLLLVRSPKRAAELLGRLRLPVGFRLPEGLLMQLLSHSRADLRLLGIQLSARAEGGAGSEELKEARGRRRRP